MTVYNTVGPRTAADHGYFDGMRYPERGLSRPVSDLLSPHTLLCGTVGSVMLVARGHLLPLRPSSASPTLDRVTAAPWNAKPRHYGNGNCIQCIGHGTVGGVP